jgi:hypothetical protein
MAGYPELSQKILLLHPLVIEHFGQVASTTVVNEQHNGFA